MSGKPDTHDEPGDLMALRARLWDAINTAHSTLKSRSNDTKLRAVHALAQGSLAYLKLVEVSDLEARIRALEGDVHDDI